MGLLLAAFVILMPLPQPPGAQPTTPRTMLPAVLFYFALAVPFLWLGIGLIRARRWAWTLTVLLSWMWLTMGVPGFLIYLLILAPLMSDQMAQQPNMPREMVMVMQLIMGIFVGCMYVALPGLFLALLHRESVRATCLRRDPSVPWTDRCPMAVLATSTGFALWAVILPLGGIYNWSTPFFGTLLSGPAGAVVTLATAGIVTYLAWGTYRLQPAAWWATLVFMIAQTANVVVTFSRIDLIAMYEQMGFPAEQLDQMRKWGTAQMLSEWGPLGWVAFSVIFLGYMLYLRRYFFAKAQEATAPT